MFTEKGYLCSDFGKNAVNDVKSCEQAMEVDVWTSMSKVEYQNEPYGCISKENLIFFNTVGLLGGSPNGESRQVCGGNIIHHLCSNETFFERFLTM